MRAALISGVLSLALAMQAGAADVPAPPAQKPPAAAKPVPAETPAADAKSAAAPKSAAPKSAADPKPATAPKPAAAESRAVMTADQVVQILDATVDWYRTLGTQQQQATQPSDLLILYANRQIAEKVVALAFEIARANAELLSSEAGAAQAKVEEASPDSPTQVKRKLDAQRAQLQQQIEEARRAGQQAKVDVLQGELDLLNARRNLLTNMAQFAGDNDATGFGANALKAHIDAIAASIPSAISGDAGGATRAAVAATPAAASPLEPRTSAGGELSQFGIWDLASTVFRLNGKAGAIDAIDHRTHELQEVFTKIRMPPQERLKELAARGDALSASRDAGEAAALHGMRDQYDTLAWLYAQTAAMVTPLTKAEVLLTQYRRNLENWHDAIGRQYGEALKALGLRVAVFLGLLVGVLVVADLWRRAVFRYIRDARRRSRFLLLRKIVCWSVVGAIIVFTFATEVSSLATFAGLITAGLAVAMQSVLVSVVGYFFLIGKFGVRVGDRVQIGNVTGEVVDLGLVRLHLMELSGEGASPTGRVVAFANSIVFQASGGLFKQIPGINLAWHEITLALPADADPAAVKQRLIDVATHIVDDYRDDVQAQAETIQRAAATAVATDMQAQVQLRFATTGVEALVRYPVLLEKAAEIDERMSRELLNALSGPDTSG